MVKLTNQQKRELEALHNMSDDEIDFSDIPERPEHIGSTGPKPGNSAIAPFCRPIWKDINLKLDEYAVDCFQSNLRAQRGNH